MSEWVELEATIGEKVNKGNFESLEIRASIRRSVYVDGPAEADFKLASLFDLVRGEVENQKVISSTGDGENEKD